MVHQPNANINFPLFPSTSAIATNMVVDSDLPFTIVKKGKQEGSTKPSSHSIPSYFQSCTLPLPPETVATAAGTNHPDAPPTKKRISTGSTTNENKNTEDPTSPPQSPPESDFSSSWLWIDLPMPIPSTPFYSHSNILFSFQSFSLEAWKIDPFLSFLPTSLASKYPTLNNKSIFPTSMHTLKHYLKSSTIASLLKGQPSEHPILWARVSTRSSISFSSLLHQLTLAHPHWKATVDLFDGMLPTPCGWLLFSSAFVQRLTLADQLNPILQAETNIDTPFLCIWATFMALETLKRQQHQQS